jgi:hypothetical protein
MAGQVEGLDDLRAALQHLPDDLTGEARAICGAAAQAAFSAIEADYPEVTGALRRGLKLIDSSGQFTARFLVSSTAPHAHLYEYGSERIRYTHAGWSRGKMPAQHTVTVAAVHERPVMNAQLLDMVRAHGFSVDGTELA